MLRALGGAVLIVVAAACTGSSSRNTAFLGRADAICGRFLKQANAIPVPDVDPKPMLERSPRGRAVRRALAAHQGRVNRLADAAFGRIHRLRPPDALRVRWRRWLFQVDAAHRAGRHLSGGLTVEALLARAAPSEAWRRHAERAYRLGRALGVKRCAIVVRYRE
jgi:hypothetical protein